MVNSVICIDAGLALKLILPEQDSQAVEMLWQDWLAQGIGIIAPTLWGYEVTSVIRNHVYRRLASSEDEGEMIAQILRLPVQQLGPDGLHQRAWELARRFNRPNAYDMHYIALAEMAGCEFWTTDEPLYRSVQGEIEWIQFWGRSE